MTPFQKLANRLNRLRYDLIPQFRADGLAVTGRNLDFLDDLGPAWVKVEAGYKSVATGAQNMWRRSGWRARMLGAPDVRWRAHIALWAARHAINLEGDLIECGVFTGILPTVICEGIPDFGSKRYWLFDTYEGIPVETVSEAERENSESLNNNYYTGVDAEKIVRDAIGHIPAVRIVKGVLPQSLSLADIQKISYLSIDLNNVAAEMAVAQQLWDRVVPGAVIVLDDFGFSGHRAQHDAWVKFAVSKRHNIATLPTGQGLIIKAKT